MNSLILSAVLLFGILAGGHCAAGIDATQKVYPMYTQGGDRAIETTVPPSTMTAVVLSTPIENANLNTLNPWRSIMIVNKSTHAPMMVTFSPGYNTFTSTFGVILSSANAATVTNTFTTNYQGVIYGIWDANAIVGSAGAYISKQYVK